MSIKATLAAINALPHVHARCVNVMGSNEYQVRYVDRSYSDDGTYYTDDAEDALGTARDMSRREELLR